MGNKISTAVATKFSRKCELPKNTAGLKRKRSESEQSTSSQSLEIPKDDTNQDSSSISPNKPGLAPTSDIHAPKRKRLKSTSKYIYKTLFLDGEDSDIKVYALGQEWKLHKLYLSQSPYFACMFNGSWREAQLTEIDLIIPDPAIDQTALKIAFGSLYRDYVFIKPVEVVGVLAASYLLQLDGLKQQSLTLMSNSISSDTVCTYYEASNRYGVEELKQECYDWLLTNLLTASDIDLFQQISAELMNTLVESPELFVMQVEMDVYSMLKKWIFLKENPSFCGDNKSLLSDIETFFNREGETLNFLETEQGQNYIQAFSNIRWQHIVVDLDSLLILEKDRIINMDWIKPLYRGLWKKMLKLEQSKDKGPEDKPELEHFNTKALRCGRVLKKGGEYCWRWVGYNYGIDLLLTFVNNLIFIKRNTLSQPNPHSASLERGRNIAYRLKVACVEKNGKITQSKSTDIQQQSLEKDEEILAMTVNTSFTFPLYLSMSILLTGHPSTQPESIDICQVASSRTLKHASTQTQKTTQCHVESQTDSGRSIQSNKELIQNVSISRQTVKLSARGTFVNENQVPKIQTTADEISGTHSSLDAESDIELLCPSVPSTSCINSVDNNQSIQESTPPSVVTHSSESSVTDSGNQNSSKDNLDFNNCKMPLKFPDDVFL